MVRHPDLSLKDAQRMFTDAQRRAVFRRDECRCQLGIKCTREMVKCFEDTLRK